MPRSTLVLIYTILSLCAAILCTPVHPQRSISSSHERRAQQTPPAQHPQPWAAEQGPDPSPPRMPAERRRRRRGPVGLAQRYSPRGPWMDHFALLHANDLQASVRYYRGALGGFGTAVLYVCGTGVALMAVVYVGAASCTRLLARERRVGSGHRRGQSRFSL